jgi:hypothetical protein
MSNEQKRTRKSDISRVTEPIRRPQLMQDLGVKHWANVPVQVLEFLTAPIFPRPVRILSLLIRQSWGYGRPDAIKGIKRTRFGHEYAVPLLQRDIVEILNIEKEHVSRTVTQLERIGALKVDGKKLLPVPNPVIQGLEKLPDSATFFSELPIFQQLENLKSEYRTELAAAVQAAIEPVRSKYLPRIQEVKTEFKRAVKAVRKGDQPAIDAEPPQGKVAESGNFSESSAATTTTTQAETTVDPNVAPDSKVAKSGNFSELSLLEKVAKNGNFQPRINIKEIRKSATPKKTGPETPSTEKPGRSVGQQRKPAGGGTDRPTEHPELLAAIEATGICARLGDTPSEKLLSVMAAQLKDAPIESFTARIVARHKSITGLGMLRELAADVAKAHAATPTRKPVLPDWERRAAMDILNDPNSSEADREFARARLAESA